MKSRDEIVRHPHNPHKGQKTIAVLLAVDDPVYAKRFQFEALDVEPTKRRNQYRIACIPFVTYGYNMGDLVEVDRSEIVAKKVMDDGQYGYRIAYGEFANDEEAHKHVDKVLSGLRDAGFDVEEFDHKISAVNAYNASMAVSLEKELNLLISEGKVLEFDTTR